MRPPVLLSTAYFPPVHYISLAAEAGKVLIEKEENFVKQSYRNRCYIATANGVISLTVPVLEGSFHKTRIKDTRIDYSKRWQQVHIRALLSAYRAAPYYEYYFDTIRTIISGRSTFLLDLDMAALRFLSENISPGTTFSYTSSFAAQVKEGPDLRYDLSPKNKSIGSRFHFRPYMQVFSDRFGFTPCLSGLDLLFNTGPEAAKYLPSFDSDLLQVSEFKSEGCGKSIPGVGY